MPRAKPTRPTRKMKQAALAALHDVVTDDASPPYAKTRAAAVLLGADKERDSDVLIERDPDAPRKYVILPAKDNDSNVRFGLWYEDQQIVFVPRGFAPELHPESYYQDVPRPAPDPRIAYRKRAETLALSAPDESEGE